MYFTGHTDFSFFEIHESQTDYESHLVTQWLTLLPGTVLADERNDTVVILYPGQRNKHAGPDIRDALLMIRGKIKSGAVECHLRSGSWTAHKHHLDPNYDQVILHVVRQVNTTWVKMSMPTVILLKNLTRPSLSFEMRCTKVHSRAVPVVNERAKIRWHQHVARFITFLDRKQPVPKILGTECFRMLGAGGNQESFIKLARSIDPAIIITGDMNENISYLADLSERLRLSWHLCGIRPSNHPPRRFPVAAALLKFIHTTNLKAVTDPVEFTRNIKKALQSYAGSGLISELLGNVFIPFLAARSIYNQQYQYFSGWERYWRTIELSYCYGELARRFKTVFLPKYLKNFSFLQGLKELDKTYCSKRYCQICPLRNSDGYLN